jgi:hypothetical protein
MGGEGARESGLVVIARFRDESQAHMAAAKLEAEGVAVLVSDVLPLRALGARSATLAVPAANVERAVQIARATPARAFLLDPYR